MRNRAELAAGSPATTEPGTRAAGRRSLTQSLPPSASPAAPASGGEDARDSDRDAQQRLLLDAAIRPDLHLGGGGGGGGGGGEGLPAPVQARMEQAFGADLSSVRVHQSPETAAVGALAYAQGDDIHFQPGRYDPSSEDGLALLGHEITHVVQQRRGGRSAEPSINNDGGLESEADDLGRRAARGESVDPSAIHAAGGGIQRMIDPGKLGGTPVDIELQGGKTGKGVINGPTKDGYTVVITEPEVLAGRVMTFVFGKLTEVSAARPTDPEPEKATQTSTSSDNNNNKDEDEEEEEEEEKGTAEKKAPPPPLNAHGSAVENLRAILGIATDDAHPAYMHGILNVSCEKYMAHGQTVAKNALVLVGQPGENGASEWTPGQKTNEFYRETPDFTGASLPSGEKASHTHSAGYHQDIQQDLLNAVEAKDEYGDPMKPKPETAVGFSIKINRVPASSSDGPTLFTVEISPGYFNDASTPTDYAKRKGWTSRSLNLRSSMKDTDESYYVDRGGMPEYNGRPLPEDQQRVLEALQSMCATVTLDAKGAPVQLQLIIS